MYAILEVVNGNFFVRSEGIATVEQAKTQYHGRCETLWNAQDVEEATIMISDKNFGVVDGYREIIKHNVNS